LLPPPAVYWKIDHRQRKRYAIWGDAIAPRYVQQRKTFNSDISGQRAKDRMAAVAALPPTGQTGRMRLKRQSRRAFGACEDCFAGPEFAYNAGKTSLNVHWGMAYSGLMTNI